MRARFAVAIAVAAMFFSCRAGSAQQKRQRDPEPVPPAVSHLPRPEGAVARSDVDEKAMRALIERLVACGTRHTLSSWTNEHRGVGCGRDVVSGRLKEIAKSAEGGLQVVIDRFEATSPRTSNRPAPLENVYGILPGRDPVLSKTIFIVSGHFDSRAS